MCGRNAACGKASNRDGIVRTEFVSPPVPQKDEVDMLA
jgi:hypothetical protein